MTRDEFARFFDAAKVDARCLCGAASAVPVRRRDRYGLPIHVVLCTHCGHVYARHRLPPEQLATFYASAYRALYSGEDGLKTEAAARSRIAASSRTMLPALHDSLGGVQGRTVLEWGCGAGWNLVPFKEAGARTFGFDFDHDYIAFGRERFGLDLHVLGSSDPLATMGGQADALILNHVLEHASDPLGLLEQASANVKPGGSIYVGLPFIETLAIWRWKDFFHVAHLHYFTVPYFVDLAAARGFIAVSVDKRRGYVVLRRAAPAWAMHAPERHRLYTALWLLRFALWYTLIVGPVHAVRRTIRNTPVLGPVLRSLKERAAVRSADHAGRDKPAGMSSTGAT